MVLLACRVLFLAIATTFVTGCNSVFFYPSSKVFFEPKEIGISAENVYFINRDGNKLHSWWLPAKGAPRGTILFLHGNAENITSHIRSVYWLPEKGWNVFLLDYRGYGESEGSPSFAGCIADAEDALYSIATNLKGGGQSGGKDIGSGGVFLFGQSLGGVIAANVAAPYENRRLLRAVILDSAFSTSRSIVRDKFAQFWITWPFQFPFALLVSSSFDALDRVSDFKGMPLLFMHGGEDPIVPAYHSKRLFEAASNPKEYWPADGVGHIGMLEIPEYRRRFLEFLEKNRAPQPIGATSVAR